MSATLKRMPGVPLVGLLDLGGGSTQVALAASGNSSQVELQCFK